MELSYDRVMQKYFDYLVSLVNGLGYDGEDWMIMLGRLQLTEFIVKIPLDIDRKYDCLALRQRFLDAYPMSKEDCEYLRFNDYFSVLEVMVELAIRIEEDVMYDPEVTVSRIPCWFFDMCNKMNIAIPDSAFGHDSGEIIGHIDERIDNWINREIEPNGAGSPFPLMNCKNDARTTPIWDQCMYYITENTNI